MREFCKLDTIPDDVRMVRVSTLFFKLSITLSLAAICKGKKAQKKLKEAMSRTFDEQFDLIGEELDKEEKNEM